MILCFCEEWPNVELFEGSKYRLDPGLDVVLGEGGYKYKMRKIEFGIIVFSVRNDT